MTGRSYKETLYVLAIALSLSLLQVQSTFDYEDRNAAAVEEHFVVAWCRSTTATKSQGERRLVDPTLDLNFWILEGHKDIL